MMLPRVVRKLRKFSIYVSVYIMLTIFMFSPVAQVYSNYILPRENYDKMILGEGNSQITDMEIIINNPNIKKEVRPSEAGSPYTPVSELNFPGSSFSAVDNIAVDHQFELNLTENGGEINNSYTIDTISDYSATNLQYNITDITSIKDYYPVESTASPGEFENLKWFNYIAWAQEFEVEWDYAKFYGAKIFVGYMSQFNPGTYELELVLVSANITTPFAPNATDRISVELGGPYDSTNLLPSSTVNNIHYYDFTDVVLEKGSYYIIANLSVIDFSDVGAKDYFVWAKHVLAPYEGKTFSMDNNTRTWSQQYNRDLTLIPELLPSDASGLSITFTNPDEVDMQDNSVSITSTTQSISGVGSHVLTSNTSVQINFDNNYEFVKNYGASSIISATNSSYWDYGIEWNLTWVTPYLDLGAYSNLDRYQIIYTPSDWHDTVFTIYYNETNTLSGSRETNGYLFQLGVNNSAGNWLLSTKSPNYIETLSLLDGLTPTDRYLLGNWTAYGTYAVGNNGSTITSEVTVKNDGGGTPTLETTGALNYTLFDSNGNLIPLKSSVPANLTFTDVTSYSLAGLFNDSAGFYSNDIVFDPSIYGSDLPGFWTAMVYWANGTEAGFYSLRIVVQTQTTFISEWEIEPGTNNWTTADITREQFDDIDIRAFYYNISEPFFVGNGKDIPSAEVTYTPSWKAGGIFIDSHPSYTATVNADSTVGVQTIDILASGPFLANHTASFDVTVFYKLAFDTLNTYYNANYTNNAYFYFALTDVSAGSNLTDVSPGSPDDMTVTVDNGTDNFVLFSPADYSFTYTGVSELWELDISTSTNDLVVGLYNVFITVQYNDYRANYTDEYVSDVFILEVSAPKTKIKIISAAETIYTYHTALINFNFTDTNHTIALTGAVVDVWFNVSDVSAVVTPVGNSYQIEVTSNNPYTIGISVYINVTKPNYEPINNHLLGTLNVITIQTEIISVDEPSDMYDGYNTSVIILFNDTDNVETIDGAYLESIITNSTSFVNISIVELGGGQYNITFINYDIAVLWLDMNITLAKPGYYNAVIRITIKIIVVQTDFELLDSSSISIYYDTGTTFDILYWDNISFVNITNPQVFFSGNLTGVVTPSYSFLDNITTITILTITDLGYYELNITIVKPGFEPQIISVYILVQERQTSVDSDETDITFYADLTDNILLNYTDELDEVSILVATVDIDFAADNSTLIVQDYFNINLVEVGSLYEITFDPIENMATGYVFIFNMTISKYGYVTNFIIITVTINIHPTDIDPSSTSQDTVYTDEDGEFTIIYETIEDDFISGAEMSYILINGTSAEIEDVVLTQIIDSYVIYVYISSSIVPELSFEIELTFYKHGFENQTWIILITVAIHLTDIDPSSDNQDTIYTDGVGNYTIIYETIEDDFISGAEMSYILINGTSMDIENVALSQILGSYVVDIYINSSIVPVTSFLIELTFYKHGYENQTWIITINIINHPTDIDPSSDNQDTINTEEDGEFTIVYETEEGDFISGAELSYILINGTSMDIENVALSQILDSYIVSVYINSSIVPVTSFLIELTFYKHGFENQTWIITLTVAIHPTSIDPSEDQDTIYADEDGEFTIVYETEEGDFITGAEMEYNIINGTSAEILLITYSPITDYYLIFINFDESLVAGKNFSIELIFYKHGFQNQTCIININVLPKITYDIILEIVGELRQLNTIQFQITLSNFSIDLLTALSFENIKFYTNPNGDFALITYIFTFANGTTKEYQIQAEFQQISEGVFVALTSEITIPWRVTEVSYIATYTPTSQSVISIESTSISESLTQNPKILELLSYMFTEFTPYMAAALAVIAAVFISLTIFFGVIRPRKQKRSAKKRGYLDKISKILASVISMRKVIVVHNETGLPVYEWDLGGEISVDSSLVSGFLQAVSGMGGEISGGEVGAVRKIDYGQFCVSSAGTDCITTYLFSTGDISADVEIGLASFVEWFEKKFHDLVSTTWDGKTEEFLSNERSIIDTLSENLFVWTLHPLSVNTVKEKDVLKLGTFSQKLYKFIKDYNEVSISVALEFFGKQPMEETLSKIFEMVDANILLRKRLR